MSDPTVADAQVRHDLTTRSQVHDLVVEFYREVVMDELLEPVFSDVAEVDWTIHMPRLVDYWCGILLGATRPRVSTTVVHRRLHEQAPIRPEHCDRWYSMWTRCVRASWSGPHADLAVSHAATLMAGMAKHVFGFAWTPPAD